METHRYMHRHPFLFSLLVVALMILVQGSGVAAAQRAGLPPSTFSVYTQFVLVVVLVILVTALRLWGEIGMRAAGSAQDLLLYAPVLVPIIGNLTFGIQAIPPAALIPFLLLAIGSGFTEELAFRGLILRAFLPRGPLTAVLVSAAFFGLAHAPNAFGVSSPLYVVLQIAYGLAIGFGFGAMAVRGRMLWPLMAAHALINFTAFLNTGRIGGEEVTPHMLVLVAIYILVFAGYGWYLMRYERKAVLA